MWAWLVLSMLSKTILVGAIDSSPNVLVRLSSVVPSANLMRANLFWFSPPVHWLEGTGASACAAAA